MTRVKGLVEKGFFNARRRCVIIWEDTRDALHLYAVSGPDDAWTLLPLPTSLSQPEQTEILDGCYEPAVLNECGRHVAMVGVDSKYQHVARAGGRSSSE